MDGYGGTSTTTTLVPLIWQIHSAGEEVRSLPLLHQLVAFALIFGPCSQSATSLSCKERIMSIVKLMDSDTITIPNNDQIKNFLSQGLNMLIESICDYGDVEALSKVLIWAWDTNQFHKCVVFAFPVVLRSIIVIPVAQNTASSNDIDSRLSRSSLFMPAFITLLSERKHCPILSKLVLCSISYVMDDSIASVMNSSSPQFQLSIHALTALFRGIILSSSDEAIELVRRFLDSLTTCSFHESDALTCLHFSVISMLENLVILEPLQLGAVESLLVEYLPQLFLRLSMSLQQRVLQFILSTSSSLRIYSLLKILLSTATIERPLFCLHHEITQHHGFNVKSSYQSTLLVSVSKMKVFDLSDGEERVIEALVAPSLSNFILQDNGGLNEVSRIQERLSFLLTCLEAAAIVNSAPDDCTLFKRQGIVVSIQHDEDEEGNDDEMMFDADDQMRSSDPMNLWRKFCTSEEILWQWPCRPSELFATVNAAKGIGSSASSQELIQLSVERLLACQFLIQRMNRYCKLNANEMKDDAIYVAMMQIIAQLSFCRHLLSMSKAKSIQKLSSNSISSNPLPKKLHEEPRACLVVDLLQRTVGELSESIPPILWIKSIKFALALDPCARYSSTICLILDAVCHYFPLKNNAGSLSEMRLKESIVRLFWKYLPLHLQCLEQTRKDKQFLKKLVQIAPYSNFQEESTDIFLQNIRDSLFDPIDKQIIYGDVVKYDDYRIFVSVVMSGLGAFMEQYPAAGDEYLKLSQFVSHADGFVADSSYDPLLPANMAAVKRALDKLTAAEVVDTLLQPSDESLVDSIMAALSPPNRTQILSSLQHHLRTAQDALIVLSHLYLIKQIVQVSADGENVESLKSYYLRGLWQVQRQLITDFTGLDQVSSMYHVSSIPKGANINADSLGKYNSWLELVYDTVLKERNAMTLAMRSRVEDGGVQTSLSVLQDFIWKLPDDDASNMAILPACLVRSLWEDWFFLQSQQNMSCGLHFLLCDVMNSYEVLSQRMDQQVKTVTRSYDSEDADNFNSSDPVSRKRNLDQEPASDEPNAKRRKETIEEEKCEEKPFSQHLNSLLRDPLWFANVHDVLFEMDSDSIELNTNTESKFSTLTLDHILDMTLRLLTSRIWPIANCEMAPTETAFISYLITLELWHTLQAWFLVHYPPAPRHITHLASWTQHLLEQCLLPRLQANAIANADNEFPACTATQSTLELLLIMAILQAAQRFFGIVLNVLKSSQHACIKLCTQVQEECDSLRAHIWKICYPHVVGAVEARSNVAEPNELLAVILGDALLHLFSYESLSNLSQELLIKSPLNETRETQVETDHQELEGSEIKKESLQSLAISHWLAKMKETVILPWIYGDMQSFLLLHEQNRF